MWVRTVSKGRDNRPDPRQGIPIGYCRCELNPVHGEEYVLTALLQNQLVSQGKRAVVYIVMAEAEQYGFREVRKFLTCINHTAL